MLVVKTEEMTAAAAASVCFNRTDLPCFNKIYLSCFSKTDLSCFNRTDLSCVNRTHLSCFNKRHVSCFSRRSALIQQNTSSLLEKQKSVLSQQFRLFKPQIGSLAPNRPNGRNGFRIVVRTQESAQMNPTGVPEPLGPVPRPKIRQKMRKENRMVGVLRGSHS